MALNAIAFYKVADDCRSGKTFSTLKWLEFLAWSKPMTIMVAAASAAQLQATILDFQDATGNIVIGSNLWGQHCLVGPSIFVFRNFDLYTKCVGQKCDILFLNEAVNLDEKSFDTLVQGVTDSVYLNYNPTNTCWVNKRINKNNLLCTTWMDNPYLTQAQRDEFEEIKRRALSPTATIFDQYNYTVFYKGQFADIGGKVFPALYTCSDEVYDSLHVKESLALDYGFVDGKDATVLIGVKIFENCLYIKQYINSKGLSNNEALAHEIAAKGIDCYRYIFADYAGCGRERIKALTSAGNYTWQDADICRGFNVVNAKKTRVVDGLQQLLQFDKIIITESSPETRSEFERYELGPEGNEVSKHQNTVDATRYAVTGYDII